MVEHQGLEVHGLSPPELEVIKEQVEEEVVAADLEVHLAADEGEAGAEFEQEVGDPCSA